MSYLHISGSFTDKDNACKFCKSFFMWGTCMGYCTRQREDVHCNESCEMFVKDTDTFDENNKFVSKEAEIDYYA